MFRAFIASRNATIYFHHFVDKRSSGIFCYLFSSSYKASSAGVVASARAGLVCCSGRDTSVGGLRVKCSRTRATSLGEAAPSPARDSSSLSRRPSPMTPTAQRRRQFNSSISSALPPSRNKKKKKKKKKHAIHRENGADPPVNRVIHLWKLFQDPPRIITTHQSRITCQTLHGRPLLVYIMYYTIIIERYLFQFQ